MQLQSLNFLYHKIIVFLLPLRRLNQSLCSCYYRGRSNFPYKVLALLLQSRCLVSHKIVALLFATAKSEIFPTIRSLHCYYSRQNFLHRVFVFATARSNFFFYIESLHTTTAMEPSQLHPISKRLLHCYLQSQPKSFSNTRSLRCYNRCESLHFSCKHKSVLKHLNYISELNVYQQKINHSVKQVHYCNQCFG